MYIPSIPNIMIYKCVCVCVFQAATVDLDVVRIAEIDQLIKAGNWDVRFSLIFLIIVHHSLAKKRVVSNFSINLRSGNCGRCCSIWRGG